MAWCTRETCKCCCCLLLQGHYGVVYKGDLQVLLLLVVAGPLWRGVQGRLASVVVACCCRATMAWCTRETCKCCCCFLLQGHYGVVYKGDLQVSGDTRSVAVKSLHAKMYNRYVEEFEKEIKMMQTLCHENIVKVIGYLPQRDSGEAHLPHGRLWN